MLPGACCRFALPEAQVAEAVGKALELVNLKDAMYRGIHTLSGAL